MTSIHFYSSHSTTALLWLQNFQIAQLLQLRTRLSNKHFRTLNTFKSSQASRQIDTSQISGLTFPHSHSQDFSSFARDQSSQLSRSHVRTFAPSIRSTLLKLHAQINTNQFTQSHGLTVSRSIHLALPKLRAQIKTSQSTRSHVRTVKISKPSQALRQINISQFSWSHVHTFAQLIHSTLLKLALRSISVNHTVSRSYSRDIQLFSSFGTQTKTNQYSRSHALTFSRSIRSASFSLALRSIPINLYAITFSR